MSEPSKPPDGPPEKDAGVVLLELCEEHKLDPFCDFLNTPSVIIPSDEHDKHWPLQSTRVRAWLAEIFFKEQQKLASEKDIAQVLRVLEGRAWNKQRRSPRHESLWSGLERDPVASALQGRADRAAS